MKIYTLEDGEYSDYNIEAMFSTKKKAEEYQVWRNSHTSKGPGEIKVWNVDETNEYYNKKYSAYVIRFVKLTSEVKEIRLADVGVDTGFIDVRDNFIAYIWARDEKHAVKIANERRAQHIALGRTK